MTQNENRALVVTERPEVMIAQKDLDLYRQHFCPDAPTNEWVIFQQKCMLLGLNPMLNEVYLVGRNTKTKDQYGKEKWSKAYATQVSITGLISLAERTQRYEGHTAAEYYDVDLNAYSIWPLSKGDYPYAIRIGVYKKGWREASYAIVYFHERAQYYGDKLSGQWKAQGIHMLLKCALAAALRWAFQETCGGVYIHEEMGMADAEHGVASIVPSVNPNDPQVNEALRETARQQQSTSKTVSSQENKKADVKVTEVPVAFNAQEALDKLYERAVELHLIDDLVGWQALKCDVYGHMMPDENIKDKAQCEQLRQEIVRRVKDSRAKKEVVA